VLVYGPIVFIDAFEEKVRPVAVVVFLGDLVMLLLCFLRLG